MATLSDRDFRRVQVFAQETLGIQFSEAKREMVSGRLARRLKHRGMDSLGAYLDLVLGGGDPQERQIAIDLLTTHETHFFREPAHFTFLKELARAPETRRPLRVWSAACSSGEEPYSIAMVLEEALGTGGWECLGTDISTGVIEQASAGHYPMDRARSIPPELLKRFCLRGIRSQEGTFLIEAGLRRRVEFQPLNLTTPLPRFNPFDVIFLRNVMIYFPVEVKRKVVASLLDRLKPGGYLIISHTETLNGVADGLTLVRPAVYRYGAR